MLGYLDSLAALVWFACIPIFSGDLRSGWQRLARRSLFISIRIVHGFVDVCHKMQFATLDRAAWLKHSGS